MTPYELRFEIFKQAYSMLSDNYHVKLLAASEKNGGKLPSEWNESYPSLDDVLKQANSINQFVSSN